MKISPPGPLRGRIWRHTRYTERGGRKLAISIALSCQLGKSLGCTISPAEYPNRTLSDLNSATSWHCLTLVSSSRRPRERLSYAHIAHMEITQTKWLSKEEAGVHLGTIERPLSTRRVLELAREGRLESGKTRDPNSGQTVVRISWDSVQTYLEKKKNPDPPPDPIECRQPSHTTRLTGRAIGDLLEALLRECANRTPARLWLTLSEAAEYSGLPAQILRSMVLSGQLEVLEVGRRRGGRWRLSRRDLEGIRGQRWIS